MLPQDDFKEHEFIEDAGLIFESSGYPRMAGKIFACLLICRPPHQSANEISSMTGGSKASISSMTRWLLQLGFIERLGIPNKRGILYKIKDGSFTSLLQQRMSIIKDFVKLAERGLIFVTDKDSVQYERLKEIHGLNFYLERELPLMMERWILKYRGR